MADGEKKVAKAKKPADHPVYAEMIVTAITTLKERNGSSGIAIKKYIKANYKVKDNADVFIRGGLKKGVEKGTLTQVKGNGASGSFKVTKVEKPKKVKKTPKKPAAKKPAAKKVTKKPAAKKAAPKKKAAAKKPAAKKATPKKKPAAPKKKTPAKKPAKKTPAKKSGKAKK
jgi:histone H1/5